MNILAIETSCDDTCIAVIKADKDKPQRGFTQIKFEILSNVVSSQVEIHKKYGGVYPTLAKREHQKNLVPVLIRALEGAKLLKIPNIQFPNSKSRFHQGSWTSPGQITNNKQIPNYKLQILKEILEREPTLLKNLTQFFENYKKPNINAIAVTVGPGLEPCLWVGVNFAKALSYFWNLPIIPVNHIEGHIFANFIDKSQIPNLKSQVFPAICLVVSGGHTQLILMKDIGKYRIIGETRDDATGECFDKIARILGLGYPGGPAIAAEAAKFAEARPPRACGGLASAKLPRPMIYSKNYDFSFSGLKTAVLYDFKKRPPKIRNSKQYIQQMCEETQQAIIDVLILKTIKAAKFHKVKTILLGGGVAANQELKKQFKLIINTQLPTVNFLVPIKKLCTDNAAMIGITGSYYFLKKKHSCQNWKKIRAEANLKISRT